MRLVSYWHEKGLAFLNSRSHLQKKILTGGFWAILVKVISIPLNLAVVGLLARLMSPEEMGTYFLAFSLVTAAATLGMLGMGQTIVRLIASSIARGDYETVRISVQQSFAWGLLGATVIALIMYTFGSQFGLPISIIFGVSVWGISQTGQNLLAEALRGFNDIRAATVFQNRSIINAIVAGVLLVFWLSGFRVDLKQVISVIVLAGFCAILFGLLLLWKKLKNMKISTDPYSGNPSRLHIFSQAMPVFGVTAMNVIRAQIGIWIVAAFLSNAEVALYGSAIRLVYLVSVPFIAVVNAFIPPIIAELFAKQQIAKLEHTVRSLATVASIAAFILTVIFVAGGNMILELIYGEFYTEAWLVLAILAVAQLADAASGSCGLTLTMTGHQKTLMNVNIISAILAVIVTIIGATLWGMLGVAVATAISLIIQNVLMIVNAKRKVGIWTYMKFSWKDLRGFHT